jgi:uncharacterized protein (DUF1697 family)
MPVFISMLRGVNVGGHNRIKMETLRSLYESLKLKDPQTFIQSGNVIFRTNENDADKLARKIKQAIFSMCNIICEVVLRSAAEMRQAIANNPFAGRSDIEPGKLLVSFLASEPTAEASARLSELKGYPEELHLVGRELYIYFPNGAGKSKLPWASLEKKFKFPPGTARNWNSVTKMLGMAETMEGSAQNKQGGHKASRYEA